jgi:hypothetical protein
VRSGEDETTANSDGDSEMFADRRGRVRHRDHDEDDEDEAAQFELSSNKWVNVSPQPLAAVSRAVAAAALVANGRALSPPLTALNGSAIASNSTDVAPFSGSGSVGIAPPASAPPAPVGASAVALRQNDTVLLDVGGQKFKTTVSTLTKYRETFFASLFSGKYEIIKQSDDSVFVDRDGTHFRRILNFLR